MEYITLILVSAMAVYFIYISYVFFRGAMIVALVSYGALALTVYIIKPSVFLKSLLVVGTIISYERLAIVIALVVLAIRYIKRRR